MSEPKTRFQKILALVEGQLYEKAMGGDIEASKLYLQYTCGIPTEQPKILTPQMELKAATDRMIIKIQKRLHDNPTSYTQLASVANEVLHEIEEETKRSQNL